MAQSNGWHRADIIAAIQKSGTTMIALASENGVHPSSLSHGLSYPVPAANKIIADHLGVSVHELWPQWFDEHGDTIPNAKKASRARTETHGQKRVAV